MLKSRLMNRPSSAPRRVLSLGVVTGLCLSGALLGGCGGVEPAIDERATQSGTLGPTSDSVACYSPTQRLEAAYEPGSRGCACDPSRDEDVCASYDDGGRPHQVPLICVDGVWLAVVDGPCAQ